MELTVSEFGCIPFWAGYLMTVIYLETLFCVVVLLSVLG